MNRPETFAIVGASCRLPGAETLDALADLLLSGRSAVSEIGGDRWTKSRYFHPSQGQPGKTYSFAAGVLRDVYAFDAAFFGISPREAVSVDPQQRLMLELVSEAIEDAGVPASRLAGSSTGVFVGASSWDFAAASFADVAALDAYGMQGAALSSVSNRISYIYGLRGPSLTVDTACSSSLVALHLACEALRREEIELAVAGGVNLLLAPQSFVGFARASMLSRLGRCHSFDARADGYVRGEGGGALIIKTLQRAIRDGDPIRAVIRGTGVNSDGRTSSFSVPSGSAQATLLRQVCTRAEVEPDDFSYIEAHGTGTPVGDPIEARAIGEAIGRDRHAPLPIGSVKSNIGHLEPASGMAGLMKLLVTFEHGVIPPSLNFETANPNIPFDELNLQVVTALRPLVPEAGLALAGINSFGFGGTNAHAILAAPPELKPADHARQPVAGTAVPPLLLSARSTGALRALAEAWRYTLSVSAEADVPALLRAGARNREHYAHRLVVTASTAATLGDTLEAWLAGAAAPGTASGETVSGDLAFVYSGNGSQWAGMGLDAMRTSPLFRAALADVDARLAPELGWSVTACLGSEDLPERLSYTKVAQPLLFAIQVAAVSALRSLGVRPAAHIGHSAGEVAAAWGSGALDLDQACHVIIQRSLLQGGGHGAGAMGTLAMSRSAAETLISEIDPDLAVAAVNAAGSVTVAGPVSAIAMLEDAARQGQHDFARLDLGYAFHSPLMEPIRAPLLAALRGLRSAAPGDLLISTVTGERVGRGELDAEYWWHNVRQPVLFSAAVARLIQEGVRNFLEIGPHPVLQHYLRDALRVAAESGRVIHTLTRRPIGLDPLAAAAAECHVAGADIAAAACFDGTARMRGLPPYPFQRQHHAAVSTIESVEVVAPVNDHPLLGFREPAAPNAWMSHLSVASEPWLADHVVDGAVVLPAAAMIDMTLAAARVCYPESATLEIQDLEIVRALVLEPNAVRDCRTTVTSDGYWQLASRPRLYREPTQPNAAGRILPGTSVRPLVAVLRPDEAEVIDAATVYALARTLHLEYGPAFQMVTRVYRFDAMHGVAELRPGNADRLAAGYLLDPALVDGSLQALLALVVGDTRVVAMGPVVPWRFGRIRLLRQHVQPVRASLHVRHIGARSVCADIALTDSSGETVVELLDCWFVAIPVAGGVGTAQCFWTARVPSLRQSPVVMADPTSRVIAAAGGVEIAPDSVLLADACASAIGYEALDALSDDDRVPAALADSPIVGTVLAWMAEDGLAARDASGWRLAASSDLPDAGEIWRSLMFGAGEAAAECAVLAALGPALAAGDVAALRLSSVLRDHAMSSSPSARGAMAALSRGLEAVVEAWPAERCLRVAVAGELHPALLARVVAQIEARRLPLRLTALTADSDVLSAIHDVLAPMPGTSAGLWSTLQDDAWHGYDVVLDFFGLSLLAHDGITADQAFRLLAPGGVLLAVEPMPGRAAELLFGPGISSGSTADLRHPDAWCEILSEAGFVTARHALLDGAIWCASLLVARSPAELIPANEGEADHEQPGLVVFAAPYDPLAATLKSRLSILRLLPIEAIRDVLTAPFAARQQHVLLLAADPADDDELVPALAELLADISSALQAMASPQAARLWLVSRGSPAASLVSAALSGLRRVGANELPLLDCRVISVDATLSDAEAAGCVFLELAAPDREAEVLWCRSGRLAPRLRAGFPPGRPMGGPRRLEVARHGLISSLNWVSADPGDPGPGEVAIEVHATALNFRDVMWAQGMLPDEALLNGFSGPSLGLECAGIVTAVGEGIDDLRPGDRVAAVAPAALATRVVTRRNGVMVMPDTIAFAAAATIPVAFMTAVYALGHVARLEAGETILIHGGAGGVGLAAIQYALHKGVVVYATAGSEMRRQMLRMLGVTGVFDSRSTSFADDVLAATGGKGVDVVLNSVSQELMKQSLRLLRPFGRFLEIGKRDLYRDTPIGIRSLRHNASYHAIDVDELMAQRARVGLKVSTEIADLLATGELQPLPYQAFGFADVVGAFRLLQSSGHIGKVVLVPEPTVPVAVPASLQLRSDGVYVVTGGLTGFGLETARWLARQGASRLALISRRGGVTPGADEALAEFVAGGVDARAFACDVAEPVALERTLDSVRAQMGPIRGVIHAAMVLDDALLGDLDAARFAKVIRPKLAGALALDRLTCCDPIDLFVLFSSVTTVIGTPGQASYVAANRALEALAERRHAAGLPALAVQWGPIGDAGYLMGEARVSEMLAAMLGSPHLRARQALDALPALLASGRPVIGLADVAWGELRGRLPGLAGSFWDEMPARGSRSSSGQSFAVRLAEMTQSEAIQMVQEVLVEEIAGILRQPVGSIGVNQPVQEFGVDSLMAVELQTALEARLCLQIPLMALTGGSTLKLIAARLVDAANRQASPETVEEEAAYAMRRHGVEIAPAASVLVPASEA